MYYTYSWHDAHAYAHAHAHAQMMTQKRTQGTRRIPQIRNSGNMLIRILIFWVLWIFLPINFLAPGGWVVPRMRLHDLPAFCGCLSIGAGSVLVRALEFVADGSSRLPYKRLGMWITGCLYILYHSSHFVVLFDIRNVWFNLLELCTQYFFMSNATGKMQEHSINLI